MSARAPVGLGVLQVEPTDHCNLTCAMCAPHHEGWETVHGVAKGYLDADLWERVLVDLVVADAHLDHVIFQWLGDPSLHPELPRLVGAAARHLRGRVGYLRVDTNAIRLGPDRMDALIDAVHQVEGAPPLLLVVTIDAHTTETYRRVKGADRLALVRRHVRHLLRRRRATGAHINLQLQFVVQEGNAHEAGPFLRYWSDLLACTGDPDRWHDEIMLKRLSVGGGADGQAAADALYERTILDLELRPGRWPGPDGPVHLQVWDSRPWQQDDGHPSGERSACPGLWLTPVIRHDGVLVMCCADLGSELQLGSLHEHGFLELWTGPAATAHRMAHLSGRFEGVCAGCGGINWYDLTPDRIAGTRARAAELGLDGSR